MLIDLQQLRADVPALAPMSLEDSCELIAAIGFPVDGVETMDGLSVLDVDVTANRGDVMSHRGLARDLAARLGAPVAASEHAPLEEGAPMAEIRLEAEACPLYATALLELGDGATPDGARAFLGRMGATAKGLPAVDASNELLHRYGHPSHAFDADTLRGALRVRYAVSGEKLRCLDGVERELRGEDLVIADDSGPIALAGVIGGDATKVTETTRRVLLESAYFDPRHVRLTARHHGVHTDASHRFGRGADPRMARLTRDLLVARLQAWCGARLEAAWAVGTHPEAAAPIALSPALLDRVAGEPIPLEQAAEVLRRLGCGVEASEVGLSVVPPSWRHDLAIAEDLAEEVLRLRGYEGIPSLLPPLSADPETDPGGYGRRRRLAERLAHLGFHQTVTYGFLRPEEDAPYAETPAEGRTLGNPLGRDYSVLRGSLIPSLKAAAEHNLRQGAKDVRLFEVAPVFLSCPEGPRQEMRVALVWAGTLGGEDYLSPARAIQGADLLGIAKDLGLERALVRLHDLGDGAWGLEAAFDALPAPHRRAIPFYKPFSRFPKAERDLSLLVDLGLAYAPLREAVAAALPAGVLAAEGVRCVDVFRHKSLPAGKQAWLLRMTFQHPDRTLTREEVDGWMAGALEAARALGAELR